VLGGDGSGGIDSIEIGAPITAASDDDVVHRVILGKVVIETMARPVVFVQSSLDSFQI